MHRSLKYHRSYASKYPDQPTQYKNECLIAHMPEPPDKQAGDQIGFSQSTKMRSGGIRIEYTQG